MPRKTDFVTIAAPMLDRRGRLLECQKERIRSMYLNEGYSMRQLAACFNVSRRLVQFTVYPERLAANKERRAERGGSAIYYDREKNTKAMREHRNYKEKLFNNKGGTT